MDLVIASLQDDVDNAELLALKEELQTAIGIIDDSMGDLQSNAPAAAAQRVPSPPHPSSSSSTSAPKHAASHGAGDSSQPVYKVNDSVLARWVSGDNEYYPARIMSVTGSATAPMYTVKFKSYDTTETLRGREIRPATAHHNHHGGHPSGAGASNKRKADGSHAIPDAASTSKSTAPPVLSPASGAAAGVPSAPPPPPPPPPPSGASPLSPKAPHLSGQRPVPPPPPAPPSQPAAVALPFGTRTIDRFRTGVVSSGAAQLFTQAAPQTEQQQQQRGGGGGAFAGQTGEVTGSGSLPALDGDDQPPAKKFKKIKATKQLVAGQNKWKEFSSKGKTSKAGTKKDSMFRTPEGIHGRGTCFFWPLFPYSPILVILCLLI